jgi:SPFH domain / Band 7 family
MKRFFKGLFILIILVCIAYALASSIEKIDKGKMGIVEDLRTKKIIRIVRPVAGGYAFVWQGLFPGRFTFHQLPEDRVALHDIKIAMPNLENLKDDYYTVGIPIRVQYRIDWQKFSDIAKLANDASDLDGMVRRYFEHALKKEIQPYLYPAYQREALANQMNAMLERIKKDLVSEFQPLGLVLVGAHIFGSIYLPDRMLYNEGLLHAADLRKVDRMIEKGLLEVKSGVARDKIKNEQYYLKLFEISKLIKNNPDILKYIYIDKLGPNVKVILSSDTTGLPAVLEEAKASKKGKPREIDNLK